MATGRQINKAVAGRTISASDYNQLVDGIKSLTPIDSETIKWEKRVNGIVAHTKKSSNKPGGDGSFKGVMLVGHAYIQGNWDSETETWELPEGSEDVELIGGVALDDAKYLAVDMYNLTVTWVSDKGTEWYIDYIPINMLSGLIVYPVVNHYIEE